MEREFSMAVLSVIIIGVLEGVALYKGLNGVALSASVGSISAVAGWYLRGKKHRSEKV